MSKKISWSAPNINPLHAEFLEAKDMPTHLISFPDPEMAQVV